MNEAFVYLALGAAITGLIVGDDSFQSPAGYVVTIAFWPFLAITIAASMIRDAIGSRL